jgi:hypothetical protein
MRFADSRHQLALELKMLESFYEISVRKALAQTHWRSQWHPEESMTFA